MAIRDELDGRGCRLPQLSAPEDELAVHPGRPVLALLQRLPLGDD